MDSYMASSLKGRRGQRWKGIFNGTTNNGGVLCSRQAEARERQHKNKLTSYKIN